MSLLRDALRPLFLVLNRHLLADGGSGVLWRIHDGFARLVGRASSGKLSAQGYYMGRLPDSLVARWIEGCRTAAPLPYNVTDERRGYVAVKDAGIPALLRDHFHWYAPQSFPPALLRDTLAELDDAVRLGFGGPWRVVNFKIVRSIAGAPDVGMYEWHKDQFPKNFHKILVYLTGATPDSGCTEIRLADGSVVSTSGPPGTLALFNANLYEHRGRPVLSGERLLLELTITRSVVPGRRVGYGGVNSCYPKYPWVSAPAA